MLTPMWYASTDNTGRIDGISARDDEIKAVGEWMKETRLIAAGSRESENATKQGGGE